LANRVKVIVVGSAGQLGRKTMAYFNTDDSFDCLGFSHAELDICDEKEVDSILALHSPDILINCAAYTAVDAAEENQEIAFNVNTMAARIVAKSAFKQGVWLLHFSTDYVFNGKSKVPYKESDQTDPLCVYGLSKRDGEQAILEEHKDACIVRTSWLYAEQGNNFVSTMARLGQTKKSIQVVDDQVSAPTFVGDLVDCSIRLIARGLADKNMPSGILHFSNSGEASWFEFAQTIMEKLDLDCVVDRISTKEFGAAADRPNYSKLDCTLIENKYGIVARPWQEGLDDCLRKRKEQWEN
jgi:dTDP-4-dehydrorhamnose reductase